MPEFMNIFYWDEWDEISENIEYYMNCEVLRDIKSIGITNGDEFETIYFDKNKLELTFYKTHTDTNPKTIRFVLDDRE